MPKVKPQASTSTLSKPQKPKQDDSESISLSEGDSIDGSQDEQSLQDSHHDSDEENEALGDLSDLPIFEDVEEENALSVEALEKYKAAQERAGVVYISRIPPGMSPNKVRHLMSAYGEVGRIYLQQEDPKRAYLRKKYTTTKKPQYTEGWVEFKNKKIARSVADMLNAQPVGGKKGSRWREDVWTMKYLPRFKWYMLTEQIAHEHAERAARLRMELSQSKMEQKHYLRQVEIGKSLDARKEKKRKREQEDGGQEVDDFTQRPSNDDLGSKSKVPRKEKEAVEEKGAHKQKRRPKDDDKPMRKKGVDSKKIESKSRSREGDLDAVLGSIF
ncbi:hypothetical protein CPB86DRAFT_779450 [Serendipita vermifera]|nr:hypothetical protein CPB86DRAFT_779450 [Serendipita vermifera]